MFTELNELIQHGVIIDMTLSKTAEGSFAVAVRIRGNADKIDFETSPMLLSGTAEDLDLNFVEEILSRKEKIVAKYAVSAEVFDEELQPDSEPKKNMAKKVEPKKAAVKLDSKAVAAKDIEDQLDTIFDKMEAATKETELIALRQELLLLQKTNKTNPRIANMAKSVNSKMLDFDEGVLKLGADEKEEDGDEEANEPEEVNEPTARVQPEESQEDPWG